MLDFLSPLARSDAPRDKIDESFPDDPSPANTLAYAGPRGLTRDAIFLEYMTLS